MLTYGIGVANPVRQFKKKIYYGYRHEIGTIDHTRISYNVLAKIVIAQKSVHKHRRPYD